MDDQWISPSGSQSDVVEQLAELQRSQDALWIQLRSEDDPERRMTLLSQFGENRGEIERLSSGLAGGQPDDDDAGVVYRVEVVESASSSPGEGSGVGQHHPAERDEPASAADTADMAATADEVSSGSLGPLSFDDAGELVASNGHTGPPDPFVDLRGADASPMPVDGGGLVGDDRNLANGGPGGPGGLAESVFGRRRPGRPSDPEPPPGPPAAAEGSNGQAPNERTPGLGGAHPAEGSPELGAAHTAEGTQRLGGAHTPEDTSWPHGAGIGEGVAADDGTPSGSSTGSDPLVVDGFGADDSTPSGSSTGSDPLVVDGFGADDGTPSGSSAGSDALVVDGFGADDGSVSGSSAGGDALDEDPAGIDADVASGGYDPSPGGVFGVGAHDAGRELAPDHGYGTGQRHDDNRIDDRDRVGGSSGADPYRMGDGDAGGIHDDVGEPRPVGARAPMARVAATTGGAPTSQYPAVAPRSAIPRPRSSSVSADPPHRALLLLGGLVLVLGVSWLMLTRGSDEAPTSAASNQIDSGAVEQPAGPTADLEIGEIVVALRNVGLDGVTAERRGDNVALIGGIPTEADRGVAVGIARSVVPELGVDGSELIVMAGGDQTDTPQATAPDARAEAFQAELRRIVAATPIIFQLEETAVTDLHARILNSVASIMNGYPDLRVTVVGFADGTGTDDSNTAISLRRAESVKAYLVSVGITEDRLLVDARGELDASGSQALANLERRVEFEVEQGAAPAAAADVAPIRIAVVGPSASNDLAFTQSMVDAVQAIAAERGNVEVAVTDGTFVPDEAAVAIRGYASDGYDLVIAHGSEYGNVLLEIVPEYPDTVFAWGTATDTLGLPNLYAYDAAAEQGGYVMGAMSMMLSSTGVVGVVGPIEVGDAERYVNGFDAGARSTKPDGTVLVTYTDSFSDLTLAAEAARSHVGAGADVLTGTSEMVIGAVTVADETGTLWFGTQANQASLAPSLVVASQVYHWEAILRPIIGDIENGRIEGRSYVADLANGGLVIEYNPDYPLPPEVRARGDEVAAAIVSGALNP